MPRLNKSTGLFGMGRGRRKGAKSKVRQFLDDKKKSKTNKKSTNSRRQSTEDIYKHSKKDSIKLYKGQGMSRKEAKEQTIKDARSTRKRQGDEYRAKAASDRVAKKAKFEADAAARRAAAPKKTGGSGLASAEESAKKASEMKQSREASKRDDLNRDRRAKNRAAEETAKGGFYEKTGSDGKARTVISRGKGESDEAFKARSTKARAEYKPKAKHGGALAIMIAPVKTKNKKTVKAIKKAPGGAAMKKIPTYKNGGKITKKQKAEMDSKAKKLQKDSKPKNPLLSTPKVKSSRRGEAVQAKEGIAEKVTSGPKLVKYYMSKAGGEMSREQAVAKMVRAKGKMMYGGSMKKAMYGAKMKKMEDGGRVTKSQKLQQRDKDLKAKATTALKEGKTKKYSRVQKRRIKVQKREQKAFMKENT